MKTVDVLAELAAKEREIERLTAQVERAEKSCSQLADGCVRYKAQVERLKAPVRDPELARYSASGTRGLMLIGSAEVNELIAARAALAEEPQKGQEQWLRNVFSVRG